MDVRSLSVALANSFSDRFTAINLNSASVAFRGNTSNEMPNLCFLFRGGRTVFVTLMTQEQIGRKSMTANHLEKIGFEHYKIRASSFEDARTDIDSVLSARGQDEIGDLRYSLSDREVRL